MPDILTDLTESYLSSVRPPADDLLEEMEAQADREGIPIAAREVARLQAVLATAAGADRVLEFGTAIGYSSIQLARVGCEVVTMDVDPDRIDDAREYARRDGVEDRIEIHEGPALEVLDDLEGPFDVAFLDAVKTEYPDYLERSLPMVPEGGLVVVDNMLWSGAVPEYHETGDPRDDATEVLHEFNREFVEHDRLDAVITPLGDGTGIGVVRE
jgi:predicted O-methyltransferase YrrM